MLELLGVKDNPLLLQVAQALEKIALEDEYFIEKKLYPNVDFYSGIILEAMGFPTSMFTVLISRCRRTVGWIAQWKEMIEDTANRRLAVRANCIWAHAMRETISTSKRAADSIVRI